MRLTFQTEFCLTMKRARNGSGALQTTRVEATDFGYSLWSVGVTPLPFCLPSVF